MELGLSLGEALVSDTTRRALPELGLGLGVGIGASATGTGRGGEEGGRGRSMAAGTGTGWWAAPEPAVRLSLVSSSLGLQWPPSDAGESRVFLFLPTLASSALWILGFSVGWCCD